MHGVRVDEEGTVAGGHADEAEVARDDALALAGQRRGDPDDDAPVGAGVDPDRRPQPADRVREGGLGIAGDEAQPAPVVRPVADPRHLDETVDAEVGPDLPDGADRGVEALPGDRDPAAEEQSGEGAEDQRDLGPGRALVERRRCRGDHPHQRVRVGLVLHRRGVRLEDAAVELAVGVRRRLQLFEGRRLVVVGFGGDRADVGRGRVGDAVVVAGPERLGGLGGGVELVAELVQPGLQPFVALLHRRDLRQELLAHVRVGGGVGDAGRLLRVARGEGDLDHVGDADPADAELALEERERHPPGVGLRGHVLRGRRQRGVGGHGRELVRHRLRGRAGGLARLGGRAVRDLARRFRGVSGEPVRPSVLDGLGPGGAAGAGVAGELGSLREQDLETRRPLALELRIVDEAELVDHHRGDHLRAQHGHLALHLGGVERGLDLAALAVEQRRRLEVDEDLRVGSERRLLRRDVQAGDQDAEAHAGADRQEVPPGEAEQLGATDAAVVGGGRRPLVAHVGPDRVGIALEHGSARHAPARPAAGRRGLPSLGERGDGVFSVAHRTIARCPSLRVQAATSAGARPSPARRPATSSR